MDFLLVLNLHQFIIVHFVESIELGDARVEKRPVKIEVVIRNVHKPRLFQILIQIHHVF